MFGSCFITLAVILVSDLKQNVFRSCFRTLAVILVSDFVYVFGSCFRRLAVILVPDFCSCSSTSSSSSSQVLTVRWSSCWVGPCGSGWRGRSTGQPGRCTDTATLLQKEQNVEWLFPFFSVVSTQALGHLFTTISNHHHYHHIVIVIHHIVFTYRW